MEEINKLNVVKQTYNVVQIGLGNDKNKTKIKVIVDNQGYLVTDPYELTKLANSSMAFKHYRKTGELPKWFKEMNCDE